MARTKEQNAAYQREYRARQAAAKPFPTRPDFTAQRIAELEEEVARLKRELATRGRQDMTIRPVVDPHPFGVSRPAPKRATAHR